MRRPMWQGSARRVRREAGSELGQTMAEYATLLGVLIIAVAAVFTAFALGINAKLQTDLLNILSGM
jgi:Flp pilus assembly pilin Flp